VYLVDYHTHPYSHGEESVKPAHNLTHLQAFIDKAKKMGIKELGFSDHDRFLDQMNWENLIKIKNYEKELSIRLGLEVNFLPGEEEEIKNKLDGLPLDYIIGSVHCLGNWEIDHPDYKDEYNNRDIDRIYTDYFASVKKAASSGLFDIVGHFDLVKIFGYRPVKLNLEKLVRPVLEVIKNNGLVMEVNTNGLNKPVQEIYPASNLLRMARELDIPLTFGSDAHSPARAGEKISYVAGIIKSIGYRQIVVFEDRRKKVIEI